MRRVWIRRGLDDKTLVENRFRMRIGLDEKGFEEKDMVEKGLDEKGLVRKVWIRRLG